MFKLKEKYEVIRKILKCEHTRYSPSTIKTINTANSQIYVKTPREYSVVFLLNSYLDQNFDVIQAATANRYADGNDIRLVNLGTIPSFSRYKLTTSSGKHLENNSHAHIVSSRYKLITSGKDTDGFSVGFDRDPDSRQRELIDNRIVKVNNLTSMLWDAFDFAEHQEKSTPGFGYKLTLTRNSDNSVLNKANATRIAKT